MTQPSVLATRQRFEIDFFIVSQQWQGLFDRLEVWRSRAAPEGPYEQLHGDTALPATLPPGFTGQPSGTGPTVFIVGKSLQLLVGETTNVTVVFTGTDPLTYAQAATQIAAQGGGLLSAFASGSVLAVQTVQMGLAAVLRCVGGDAAPLLGLATAEPGSVGFGQDPRIVLINGRTQYGVIDPNGDPSFFYKTRFFNSPSRLAGQFTAPFQNPPAQGLSDTSLVLGYVNLVDQSGNPAVNQEVLVHNEFGGLQLEGRTVVGGTVRLLTDSAGHAEILLPRGATVRVAIGGTSLARDVVLPTDTTIQTLDLLSPSAGSDDLFAVQVPAVDYAVRRTL